MRLRIGLAAAVAAGGLWGGLRIAVVGDSTAERVQAAPAAQQLELGEAIYLERCAVCHGVEGDGNGPAAAGMDPQPRDFRRGWFKIRSTASGQLPTDSDLIQIIRDGMPGTTMQAWGEVLSQEQIAAVAVYVKTFSGRFERETPEEVPRTDPPGESPERVQRGAQLYAGAEAECIACHGVAGRGDGASADQLTDDLGDPIVPADLSMPWLFRGGAEVEDIYLRLKTGLTGSPMPSYANVLNDDQVWDLAYYVDSLGPDREPEASPFILASRIEGALPAEAADQRWQQAEQAYVPLAGQVMREPRNFTPSISAVWVQALHNGRELALKLRWHDRFHDAADPADMLGVILPSALSEADDRPYFVYGEQGDPVNVWLWSAALNAVEELSMSGTGTGQLHAQQDPAGRAEHLDGEYNLVVQRALHTGDPDDLSIPIGSFVPITFSASDARAGEDVETGSIGSWQLIYLEAEQSNQGFIAVPVVVAVVGLAEWLLVRRIRRSTYNSRPS